MSTKKTPSKSSLARQLALSHNYLNNILTLLPEHIYWMDLDGKIVGCNEQQAKSFGLSSANELIGMNIYDVAKLLGWDDSIPNKIRENDIAIMATGKPMIAEEPVVLEGKKKIFLSHKSPLRNKNGKIIGVIGVATDITEMKASQEKILQLEKEKTVIETKHQVVSDLAASIAHEIGNLLGGIMINMHMLDSTLRPKIKTLMKKNADEYRRTLELLDDLKKGMENAKFMFESIKLNIRSGGINRAQFELANIATDINTVLNNCFPGEEIIANIEWDKDANFEYTGIPAYTRNVLINLLKNSLYFIKEQHKGKISITIKPGETFNQLIIEDTAKGISEELLPKIFSRFSTTHKSGMGMGLAFCKQVMEECGGTIMCESKINRYTRFILNFPAITN